MAKLTKHDKKSIEKSMAVPAERGPVWNRRPVVFRISAAPVPAETERWNV